MGLSTIALCIIIHFVPVLKLDFVDSEFKGFAVFGTLKFNYPHNMKFFPHL